MCLAIMDWSGMEQNISFEQFRILLINDHLSQIKHSRVRNDELPY